MMIGHKNIDLKKRYLFLTLNFISWFACVIFANTSFEVFTISVVLLNVFSAKQLFGHIDRVFFIKALFVGLIFDQVGLSFGLIRLAGLPVLPLWLICLWIIFVLALPMYQQIFKDMPRIAIVTGAALGPLSYLSGEEFGILAFNSAWGVLVYILFWGFYFWYFTQRLRSI